MQRSEQEPRFRRSCRTPGTGAFAHDHQWKLGEIPDDVQQTKECPDPRCGAGIGAFAHRHHMETGGNHVRRAATE
jgi:hypothetical protein